MRRLLIVTSVALAMLACLAACAAVTPTEAPAAPTVAAPPSAIPTNLPPTQAPTEPAPTSTVAPTEAATEMAESHTHVAEPFNVSVAQYFMDTAGFHDLATVLSDTQKIEASYLSKVTRVGKVLAQTAWPADLREQGLAFGATLDEFAAALEADNVADAVRLSEEVHDAQHEFSHAIDAWLGTASDDH